MGNTTVREKEHNSNRHRYDSGPTMVGKHSEESSNDGLSYMKGFLGEPHRPRSRANTSSLSLDVEKTLPTVFKWEGGGKQVYISGSFNGWKAKIPLVKSHGDFYTIIDLPEGDHQYKFYVDGQWQCDSKEATTDNEYGTKNNLVRVKATDFEVFDALEVDSRDLEPDPRVRAGSPAGEYGQVYTSKSSVASTGPPLLPPQLLQVILNKETSQQCEPTLLPEPNHVMLNHLYALSIKDGVMVLSTAHRYRKKYITSLLYKPI